MELSAEGIWRTAQDSLRAKLSTEIYNLWFSQLRARGIDQQHLVLQVANEFCGTWLKDHYRGLLDEAVGAAAGKRLSVVFEVDGNAPFQNKPSVVPVSAPSNQIKRGSSRAGEEFSVDPRNKFETFVVGEGSSFAHAAALAVAGAPGKAYNPLFLYGGVGLGKTHLLHAIGHHVTAHNRGARVAYMSSERFTNSYIEAIQNNQLGLFRRKCRQAEVLLIDDVQFLAGKERIQEEFFHTFNALHEARKQIVLTCDRPAGALQNLEQRLVSRFEWGLVTDLQPPDGETRLAILRKKAALLGVEVPDEIMAFLANRIRTNIRRLEGALIRVVSYGALTGRRLSLDSVEGLLREILQQEAHHTISIETIQKKVAEHFDIRLADMMSKRRPENIAFPRQIAMFFSRRMTDNSLNAIGEAFGGRDHGTVMHACRMVKERMEVDSSVRQLVGHLEMKLSR